MNILGGKGNETPKCPICGRAIKEHESFDLGSAVLGAREELLLNEAVLGCRWVDASKFQAANIISDIKVWRIFLCQESAVIFPIISRIELWDDDVYGNPFILDAQQAMEVCRAQGSLLED